MNIIKSSLLTASDIGRFWSKVNITQNPEECWIWKGSVNNKGYGSFATPRKLKITKISHRVAYLIHYGELDQDLLVCHECDNPSCVNPNHLFQGTAKENSQDMVKKGRSPRGSKQGLTTLTELDVVAIRECLKTGRFEQKELANKFCVSQQTISRINTRKDWRHI